MIFSSRPLTNIPGPFVEFPQPIAKSLDSVISPSAPVFAPNLPIGAFYGLSATCLAKNELSLGDRQLRNKSKHEIQLQCVKPE